MTNARTLLMVGVVALLFGTPSTVEGQDCIWCLQCDYPLQHRMRTADDEITMDFILWINMNCRPGEEGECSNGPIPCPFDDGAPTEQAQLAGLIKEADAIGLRRLVKASDGKIELVPERRLLLYRSRCRKDKVLGVFQLDGDLFSKIELQGR